MTEETVQPATHEPLFNVPPLTLCLGFILLGIFLAMQYRPEMMQSFVGWTVFVPSQFTHHPAGFAHTLLSYGLLHFGWPHIIVNVTGLLAFGSGIERMMGRMRFIVILLGGTLAGALGHWALFPQSLDPLGGASAGISALVGAVFPLIMPSRKSLAQASAVFILANIAVDLVGMSQQPDATIAWQAHLFGFAFGLIYGLAFVARMKKRRSVSQSGASNDNIA